MTSEKQLQTQVADFLRLQYPDVLFHSDYGSGVKLTSAQAAIQKRQNGGRRAWPDMFIAEKSRYFMRWNLANNFLTEHSEPINMGAKCYRFIGLFLELKKDGEIIIAKGMGGGWVGAESEAQLKAHNEYKRIMRERGKLYEV